MKYDFDTLVNIWMYDAQNYANLCHTINDKVGEHGNAAFEGLSYAQLYSLMKNQNNLVKAALANSRAYPIILDGVIIDILPTARDDEFLVTLADKAILDESITTNSARVKYLEKHTNLITNLLQIAVRTKHPTIGDMTRIQLGTVVHVAVFDVDCTIIPNTIVADSLDVAEHDGDNYFFGSDNVFHGAYDFYYKYYEIRTELADYVTGKGGPSTGESLSSAWNSFISEIRAENEKEKRKEYLENKKLLDPEKTRQDYERLMDEASQRNNEANDGYIALLDNYIANGTEEEKVHANSLKTEEKQLVWLQLLAFILGVCTFCAFGGEHLLPLVTFAAALIVNVIFVCRIMKKAELARKFFADTDERIEKLHKNSKKASEDSMQARKKLEIYEKVEKYERKHK